MLINIKIITVTGMYVVEQDVQEKDPSRIKQFVLDFESDGELMKPLDLEKTL